MENVVVPFVLVKKEPEDLDHTARTILVLADEAATMEESTGRVLSLVDSLVKAEGLKGVPSLPLASTWRGTVGVLAAAVAIVVGLGALALALDGDPAPPLTVREIRPLTEASLTAGDFTLLIEHRLTEPCRNTVDRVWVHPTGAVVANQRVYGGLGGGVSEHFKHSQLRAQLPNGIEPADYVVRTTALLECKGGDSHVVRMPEYKVRVVL